MLSPRATLGTRYCCTVFMKRNLRAGIPLMRAVENAPLTISLPNCKQKSIFPSIAFRKNAMITLQSSGFRERARGPADPISFSSAHVHSVTPSPFRSYILNTFRAKPTYFYNAAGVHYIHVSIVVLKLATKNRSPLPYAQFFSYCVACIVDKLYPPVTTVKGDDCHSIMMACLNIKGSHLDRLLKWVQIHVSTF